MRNNKTCFELKFCDKTSWVYTKYSFFKLNVKMGGEFFDVCIENENVKISSLLKVSDYFGAAILLDR